MEEAKPNTSFVLTFVANADIGSPFGTNMSQKHALKLTNQLGERLKSEIYKKAYSSTSDAAQETAKAIFEHSENKNAPRLRVDARLRERESTAEVSPEWLKEAIIWSSNEDMAVVHYDPPGAETFDSLKNRGINFLEELCAMECEAGGTSKDILVVSHNYWILAILEYLVTSFYYQLMEDKSIDNAKKLHYEPFLSPTSVSKVRIFRNIEKNLKRKCEFLMFNDTTHVE